jgi:putative DNA primase/helicase
MNVNTFPDIPENSHQAPIESTEESILRNSIEHYDYRLSTGELVYRSVRHGMNGSKKFLVFHQAPEGTWEAGLGGREPILYGLKELASGASHESVFVVEGEKDVDRLHSLGQIAVTNPFGAGKWKVEYSHDLEGRNVFILPDNDEPGRKHAEKVKKSLSGIANSVRIVELPGLPEKGDVSDWLDGGASLEDLESLTSHVCVPNGVCKHSTWESLGREFKTVAWEWPGWLPRGFVTIVAGRAGTGKSALVLWIARCLSTGEDWPDGQRNQNGPSNVLWCETEAAQAINIARARAWSVPVDRIISPFDDHFRPIDLGDKESLRVLKDKLSLPDVRLAVIDSFSGAHSSKENKTAVGALTRSLAEIARDTNKPILLVHHLRKADRRASNGGARNLIDLDDIRGSSAIPQAARVVWALEAPDENGTRFLHKIKNNLAPPSTGLECEIHDAGLSFAAPHKEETLCKISELKRAALFIMRQLHSGPLPSKELQRRAEAEGISKPTLERARKELGIRAKPSGGAWQASMPEGKREGEGVENLESLE